MRYDKNFAMFAKHTEWYDFVVGVGYLPTEKAPLESVLAMLEYNSYTFKNNHCVFEKRMILSKVKFLIENKYPTKELLTTALSDDGFDKITDIFNKEKELHRIKQKSDALVEWPKI